MLLCGVHLDLLILHGDINNNHLTNLLDSHMESVIIVNFLGIMPGTVQHRELALRVLALINLDLHREEGEGAEHLETSLEVHLFLQEGEEEEEGDINPVIVFDCMKT
jgi:hypothetical protein